MQIKLQEKDEDQAENKTRTKDMNATKNASAAAEFTNPAELLKIRLDKVLSNNKEKKGLMDMYIRNVNIIRDAFDQINGLGGEIDMIDEQNRNIQAEIERHEVYTQMNEEEKIATKANLEKEIAEMKELYK